MRKFPKFRRVGNKRGFTLMELMVVIVILGLLMALVGPKFFKQKGKGDRVAARTQIELFGQALDSFRLDTNRYPTTDEGLRALIENPGIDGWDGPYLRKKTIPLDPWRTEYVYKYPGSQGEYDLLSYGLDGTPGGEGDNADIVSWE
jgi:general secretion pathway protein G